MQGNVEAVELLVAHGARVNNRDTRGNRPLHAAAFLGHDAVVSLSLWVRCI